MKHKRLLGIFFLGFTIFIGPERFVLPPKNAQVIEKAFGEVFLTYPRLHGKEIHLVFHNGSKSLMQAWPTLEPDTYLVFVSANSKYQEFLASLSEDQIKGWFAHEFGHIMDYQQYSQWEKAGYVLKYIFSVEFQRKSEKFADTQAIYHGYGLQLLDGVVHSLESDKMPAESKQKLQNIYPSLKDLRELIKRRSNNKK